MADRPGIMIYFDVIPQLQEYSVEEVGKLFLAALEYGSTGSIPCFTDRGLRVIWRQLQEKLDRDGEKYQKKVIDGAFGLYKRHCNEVGQEPLTKNAWYNNVYLPSQVDNSVSGSMMQYTEADCEGVYQQEQVTAKSTEPITETTAETNSREQGTGTRGTLAPAAGSELAESLAFEDERQRKLRMLYEATREG